MAGNIYHEWDGTTLIVTSDSGTSACDLKGQPGDIGVRGPQGIPGVVLNPDGTIFEPIVDTELSSDSENPVQNKVITEELEGKLDKVTSTDYLSRVYAVLANGQQKMYEIPDSTVGATPNRIPIYFGNTSGSDTTPPTGVLLTGTPTKGSQAANKFYVDTALEDKVDKVTDAVYYNRVYGIDGNGEQKVFGMGFEPYQYRLAQYMPPGTVGEGEGKFNATLKVGTPIVGNDATNKSYVDKGMWLPAYDATVTYAKDVMVIKDGKIYKSLIDDNIGNLGNTETEATSWEDLLSGKVDKKTTNPGYAYVYGYSGANQTIFRTTSGMSSVPTGYSSIPAYAPNTDYSTTTYEDRSVIMTGTPKYPAHCANKAYVDEQIASVPKYYNHILKFSGNGAAATALYLHLTSSKAEAFTADEIQAGTVITNYIPYPCATTGSSNLWGVLILESGQLKATIPNGSSGMFNTYTPTFDSDTVTEI